MRLARRGQGKSLVLAGGGHAHLAILADLAGILSRGHSVTVIGPSPYHYYSGMGPGALGGSYRPEEIRFAIRRIVEKQGGRFLTGEVLRIDPEVRTVFMETGETCAYDVISFNTGSHVPPTNLTVENTPVIAVKPIENLIRARQLLSEQLDRKQLAVGIVGGGPSAAEIAGNVLQLGKSQGKRFSSVRIFSGTRFMDRFPAEVRKRVETALTRRGIDLVESGHVSVIENGNVLLDSGRRYPADIVFLATGVKPSPIFSRSGLPTGPDGGLIVNRYLQCPAHPDIFGGGDCIHFQEQPLEKVGVYAVRQNPVLLHNLTAQLDGRELRPFDPGGAYLMIFNLGEGLGVLHKKRLVFSGRTAFWIKDRIDRGFMKKWKAME
ncbi:MAG: NAD(P)/FAD-dependent oxidoreductase [Thermodesulfobacteriota bacterium]